MLHAIFPSIARLPNVGTRLVSRLQWNDWLRLFLGCYLLFPYHSGPEDEASPYAKLIVFIISAISMLGSNVGKAGGLGPIARQGSTVHGMEKMWLVLRFLMLGSCELCNLCQ